MRKASFQRAFVNNMSNDWLKTKQKNIIGGKAGQGLMGGRVPISRAAVGELTREEAKGGARVSAHSGDPCRGLRK